jgi:hypothetical protein
MSNVIRSRYGRETDMPRLDIGEIFFCVDTHNYYIGTKSGNILVVEEVTRWKLFRRLITRTVNELIKIIKMKRR